MAFYRYSAYYPDEDGERMIVRSMVPLSLENEKNSAYTHLCYTSEKDDCSYYYVISLGHEAGWAGKIFGPRLVDRFIIHYVVNGKGTFNGKPVEAGNFFFSHPYDNHVISSDITDPMEFYYIGLSGPGAEELMKRAGFFSISEIQPFHFQEKIAPLFQDALYTDHPDTDKELYFLSVFFKLLSFHQVENIKNAFEHNKMGTFHYYKEALIFIQDYLLEGITPRDVAEHLHISASYLRAIFSKHCEYSVRELLIRKRIECAASRLTFEGESVGQVSMLVGYNDYKLFSKIFKKYTGHSPMEYKKQHFQISLLPENINRQNETK